MSIIKNFALLFFTVTLTMLTTITGFANVYPEIEPNDTKESAQLLQCGTQTLEAAVQGDTSAQYFVKGELNTSTDEDWYKIALSPLKKNYLTINRYTGSRSNNTTFELYNGNGVLLQTFEYTSDQVRVFRLQTDVAQTYYMRVHSSNWTGDFSYVMQMGNPEPDFKSLYKSYPSTQFGKNYPQWSGTWDLSDDISIPTDSLCYNVVLEGFPSSATDSRQFRNHYVGWTTMKSSGIDVTPVTSFKTKQLWQFKAIASGGNDRTFTPRAVLRFVYFKLPPEEM